LETVKRQTSKFIQKLLTVATTKWEINSSVFKEVFNILVMTISGIQRQEQQQGNDDHTFIYIDYVGRWNSVSKTTKQKPHEDKSKNTTILTFYILIVDISFH